MTFSHLIAEFSEKNELTLQSQEGSGDWSGAGPCSALLENDGTKIDFFPLTREELRIEAEISSIEPDTDEAKRTLISFLKGNLALLKSQNGSVALSPDKKRIIQFQRFDHSQTGCSEFTEMVESFLDLLDTYRRGLVAST